MLKQKLTALSCVIGIVALGACSYGSPAAAPPAPVSIAPTIDLLHLHSIRVAATSASSPPRLIPNEVALAFAIAWSAKHTGVAVHADPETHPREALLDITVVSERAPSHPPSGKVVSYSFPTFVSLTTTLTSQSGDLLWHENAYQYFASCPLPSSAAAEAQSAPQTDPRTDPRTDPQTAPWSNPAFRACVTNSLALQLADKLLHSLEVPR